MNKTTSLALSKRMKELGAVQESEKVWIDIFPIFNYELRLTTIGEFKDRLENSILSQEARKLVITYSAFDASELGEMLPATMTKSTDTHFLRIEKAGGLWTISYPGLKKYAAQSGSMAESMGEMWCYLKENKLI
jgi:hypothetical protein